MSVLSEDNPTNPQDPLHYAPRRTGPRPDLRLSTVSTSVGETPFDRPSRFEPARRAPSPSSALNAELEHAVFESLRRQMDPEVLPEPISLEPSRYRAWLAIFAGVGAAGIAAMLISILVPHGDIGALFSLSSASVAQEEAPKPALAQFRSLVNSSDGEQTFSSEQSDRLLQQFVQWRQKADGPAAR
jgi:hypothetical protein